jgi:hypothetical protein
VADEKKNRPPRGALIVVAIGLIACVAAALLSTDEASGEAAQLEWVRKMPMANSKPVPLPGGGTMQLSEGAIRTTGTNVSGYSLFRVSSQVRIEAGAPVGSGRILCNVSGDGRAEIAQTRGGLRATYPRSSTGLFTQEVPEVILLFFSSHGTELAVVELDGVPEHWSTEKGVKLEWPKFQEGLEHLEYFLPAGKPKQDLVLPFETIWRTSSPPGAKVACTVTTSAGKATARTAGAIKSIAPPIDEEAEEEKQEEREEVEAEAEKG